MTEPRSRTSAAGPAARCSPSPARPPVAAAAVTALLVNIFERKQEAQEPLLPRRRADRRHRRPGRLGQELPAPVRRLPAHRRPGAHALRRQRGPAAHADRGRPALGRGAVAPRGGPAAEDDVGRLRLRASTSARSAATPTCSTTRPTRERLQQFKQPGTCIHCHASVYVPYKKAGDGDLIKGFEAINQMPYAEARKTFTHPVACIDCHDPDTMELRVTRPGFLEGIKRAEGQPGRQGLRRQPHGHAPGDALARLRPVPRRVLLQGRREAADLSVGQGPQGRRDRRLLRRGRLQGLDPRRDRGAACSRRSTPSSRCGTRASTPRSGVACADCHMPYMRVGAIKISDHHVRSPLLNINNACQTCHKWPEDELLARAEAIQERTVSAAQPRDGRADGADRRHQGGEGGRRSDAELEAAHRAAASRAVLPRLRRGRELHGLPRAAGGRRASWARRSTTFARARFRCGR